MIRPLPMLNSSLCHGEMGEDRVRFMNPEDRGKFIAIVWNIV